MAPFWCNENFEGSMVHSFLLQTRQGDLSKEGLLLATKSCLSMLLYLALVLSVPGNMSAAADSSNPGILKAPDMANLMPATVFFRGQVASVQARNSGGVRLADGMLVLCALVDTSGYSTAVQQKYQGYFITEVALDINGHTLKPGAYGVGFVEGNKFLVMDLGAHDLFIASGVHDAELKRPTPLQVLADTEPNRYRLYINRNYVVFSPASGT
jgi:hypothetical protein